MKKQMVVRFGLEKRKQKADAKVHGGKGAGLVEMSNLGVPVPPGFLITTDVSTYFFKNKGRLPGSLGREIDTSLKALEKKLGKKFGDPKNPLLVSVRSGAPVSMPGMMDTILNLGLTPRGVVGLGTEYGNMRFAWDTYRRLIQMFSEIVLEVPAEEFDGILDSEKKRLKVNLDSDLSAEDLELICSQFLACVKEKTGKPFPESPRAQLDLSVAAVFRSWNTKRAQKYREINKISHDMGTAVNVQAMVFGNRGDKSATGVLFSRNPSTGDRGIFGEYLVNAQGEDVVAGTRTPGPLNADSAPPHYQGDTLQGTFPANYADLAKITRRLEKHYGDMQDIEFTIEEGRLWILQTRSGKRTARAGLKIAVDMVGEKLIDRKKAVQRVVPNDLNQLLHPVFDPKAERDVLAKGLAASPGAVSGKAVFSADEAERMGKLMEKVILIRAETSPEDIHGMQAAQGVLTSRGGMTSHAAVVARGMGKSCIVGCTEINVYDDQKYFTSKSGERFDEGTIISMDGSTGEVLRGAVPTVESHFGGLLDKFLGWADQYRELGVRANADTPGDCRKARSFGAEGVGLCRTEHMFFDKERIDWVRRMILAKTAEERKECLYKIYPFQLEDFREIFRAMPGLPVTIRLLDPPLHEFLPRKEAEIHELAERLQLDEQELTKAIENLHEFNPMLGHRGCRLAITYPEIYEMQVRAIVRAAIEVEKQDRLRVFPEIMVPLVLDAREFKILKDRIIEVAEGVKAKLNSKLRYTVGTMIELPRAAIVADQIAEHAAFFSFGTNDMTQMMMGLSRDDAGRFLPSYVEEGILPDDPFTTVDVGGVVEIVRMGTERGRKTKKDLKVGVCGEHGGDPQSIHHFHDAGLDYVSCSPLRVPLARLAAAQAALEKAAPKRR